MLNQHLGLCALALFCIGIGWLDTPLADEEDEAWRVDCFHALALVILIMAVVV